MLLLLRSFFENLRMREQWRKIAKKAAESLPKSYCLVYFQKTEISTFEKGILTIGLPREFYRPWMEKTAKNEILLAARNVFPDCQEVDFAVDGSLEESSDFDPREILTDKSETKKPAVKKTTAITPSKQIGFSRRFLHPDLTFDHFVAGENTALAHAAARTAAENPGRKYSPLFLFGGVGLGKTHLLHAVGHAIAEKFTDANIIILPTQKFVDEVVSSVRSGKADEIRAKFGRADVFMLDDIQFLAGKERTQEILFHIFNDLHHHGKQILLSSDRPPSSLNGLEERLVSRFFMGMIADIQPPDFETRLAILEEKNQEMGDHFSKEALEQLAENMPGSVRELLGVFSQMLANFELQGMRPNRSNILEICTKRNRDLRHEREKTEEYSSGRALTIQEIAERVAEYFEVPLEKLISSSRLKEYTVPRQIAMFFAHRRLKESLQKIGNFFGGRDHTSVLSAVRRVEKSRKLSTDYWREVNEVRKILGL